MVEYVFKNLMLALEATVDWLAQEDDKHSEMKIEREWAFAVGEEKERELCLYLWFKRKEKSKEKEGVKPRSG